MACSGLSEERTTVPGIRGVVSVFHSQFCGSRGTACFFDRYGCPIRLATGWIASRTRPGSDFGFSDRIRRLHTEYGR